MATETISTMAHLELFACTLEEGIKDLGHDVGPTGALLATGS